MRLSATIFDEALDAAPLGDVETAHASLAEQAEQPVTAECLSHGADTSGRVGRMSLLDHAETLSSLYARWFRADTDRR